MRKLILIYFSILCSLSGAEFLGLKCISNLSQKEVTELLSDWDKKYPKDEIYEIRREWQLSKGKGSGQISIIYNVENAAPHRAKVGMERMSLTVGEYDTGDLLDRHKFMERKVRVLPWRSILQSCIVYEGMSEQDIEFLEKIFQAQILVEWNDNEYPAPLLAGYVVKIEKDSDNLFRLHMTGQFYKTHLMVERVGKRKNGYPLFRFGPWNKVF